MGDDEKTPDPPLTGITPADIYEAKAERRRRLANLSIDERVDLIEKLRDMGRDLIEARNTLEKSGD